jgi:hydroxyacylglutathione hydrolase
VKQGSVRSNDLGIGFDTDDVGTVIDRRGEPVPGIYAIGPLRDGGLFETTAVPEIGQQARALGTEITGNAELRPKDRTRPQIRI